MNYERAYEIGGDRCAAFGGLPHKARLAEPAFVPVTPCPALAYEALPPA
jgi:hypothetical protein